MTLHEGIDITYRDFMKDQEESLQRSEIQRFYEDATVFITGGTGFMGTILIEKLLRSCPKIKKIYTLVRTKKGKDFKQRFQEQFESPIFDVLKRLRPDFQSKIVPVSGDCGSENLGLSSADREMLVDEVNIIFHAAATIRFDETLRNAVKINVKGTKFVLDLAHEVKSLKVMVHISTAYSNCPNLEIHEKFYPAPMTYSKIVNTVELFDDKTLEIFTPKLIDKWPNAYSFTKSIAEDVVKEFGKGLPIGVFRPSIVMSVAKEPLAGWVNNLFGVQGICFGIGIGLIRTFECNPNNRTDWVPVDYAINAMIAFAWDIASIKNDNSSFSQMSSIMMDDINNNSDSRKVSDSDDISEIPILHYVSSSKIPTSWKQLFECGTSSGDKMTSMVQILPPGVSFAPNRYLNYFYRLLFHYLPAIILDGLAILLGKEPMLWNAYKKIHKFSDLLVFFSTQEWKFHDDNMSKLWNKLNNKDKEIFYFDIAELDWREYINRLLFGLRVYIAKDDLSTLPQAKKRYLKIQTAYYTVTTGLTILLIYFIWSCIRFIFL